jgi:hypothetical protein
VDFHRVIYSIFIKNKFEKVRMSEKPEFCKKDKYSVEKFKILYDNE